MQFSSLKFKKSLILFLKIIIIIIIIIIIKTTLYYMGELAKLEKEKFLIFQEMELFSLKTKLVLIFFQKVIFPTHQER